MKRLALLFLCVPLAGCFLTRDTTNVPLEPERIARLEPGVTTATQALELLGGPVEVVQLGRRSAWLYEHQRTKRSGLFLFVFTALNTDTQQDRLWLFFDENDVLRHAGATLDAKSAEWVMPWSDSHE